MLAFLTWGFLVGLQHALEPDHLAAVGSLASRHRGTRALSSAGLFWGLGHAIPLVVIGGAALLAHATIPARFEAAAEMCVGAMLVFLGGRVLYRLWTNRIHVHVHRHADGTVHAHAHSHRHGEAHEAHDHPGGLKLRSTLVGVTHGLAGSAALVVMAGTAADSAWSALGFVLLFSAGAAVGMAALGAIVSVPTRWGILHERSAGVVHLVLGCVTVGLGLNLLRVAGEAWLTRS